MYVESILAVMENERECVARQENNSPKCPKDENGVRLCGQCDLCLPTESVLEAYDEVIESLKVSLKFTKAFEKKYLTETDVDRVMFALNKVNEEEDDLDVND